MARVPSLRSGFRLRAPGRHGGLTPAKRLNIYKHDILYIAEEGKGQ
jgi:hypothetical protein